MQRDRTVDRSEGSEPLILVLDEQLVVKQPPPQRHHFAGERRIHFVADSIHLDPGVDTHPSALWLTRKGAESVRGTHRPQASLRQGGQPVLDPRTRLRAVRLGVVADKIVPQPQIGLRLVLWRMEMIERLVRFFDGPVNLSGEMDVLSAFPDHGI